MKYAERQACIDMAKEKGRVHLAELDAPPRTSAEDLGQVDTPRTSAEVLGQVDTPRTSAEGMQLVRELGRAWPRLPQWVKDMLRRFARKYGETVG